MATAKKYPKHKGSQGVTGDGKVDLSEWGVGTHKPGAPREQQEPVADFSGVAVTGNTEALTMLPMMVATLREKQLTAQLRAEAAERAAADLAHFQMVVLPEAMELAGVKEYTLADGSELSVKPDLKVSIPKEDLAKREACFTWLRANEHGEIIKTFFDIDVRPLKDKQRASLRKLIEKKGLAVDMKQDVHWQTLKSLVKELLEKGTELPPDFSIHQFKKASLKEPKKG